MGDEAKGLDRLVANLLSLSRIEADALAPVRQPVRVGELAAYSCERLARVLVDRRLIVNVPDDLPLVSADYSQIDQVLTNRLENAARHSPPVRPSS